MAYHRQAWATATTRAVKDAPFSKEIPDGELWLPTSKLLVVETLHDAFDERAAIVFVGEPGVGKACVLRALRHRIPPAGFRLTYCHNATFGRRDFDRQLCQALGLSPASTAGCLCRSRPIARLRKGAAVVVTDDGEHGTRPIASADGR